METTESKAYRVDAYDSADDDLLFQCQRTAIANPWKQLKVQPLCLAILHVTVSFIYRNSSLIYTPLLQLIVEVGFSALIVGFCLEYPETENTFK